LFGEIKVHTFETLLLQMKYKGKVLYMCTILN